MCTGVTKGLRLKWQIMVIQRNLDVYRAIWNAYQYYYQEHNDLTKQNDYDWYKPSLLIPLPVCGSISLSSTGFSFTTFTGISYQYQDYWSNQSPYPFMMHYRRTINTINNIISELFILQSILIKCDTARDRRTPVIVKSRMNYSSVNRITPSFASLV